MDLATERAKRWGYDRPLLPTLQKAAAWIDDLGFALLFEHKGQPVPSLLVRAVTPTPDEKFDWGPEAETVWTWKDELPRRGLAWYGHFVNGRKSFLSPRLLTALYPREGTPDDYRSEDLSTDARRIADVLLPSGPLSAATIREATGLKGSAYDRAIKELGRKLVITHAGIEEQGAGWPSSVLDLTVRAFSFTPTPDPALATRLLLNTTIECMPNHLARAYGWMSVTAGQHLHAAVAAGIATRDGSRYRVR